MMMFIPSQLAYLPMHDQQALYDWLMYHATLHRQVAVESLKRGIPYQSYQLDTMAALDDWVDLHQRQHDETSNKFNISDVPDLTAWDFDDSVAWDNFLNLHALQHDAERKALNLT